MILLRLLLTCAYTLVSKHMRKIAKIIFIVLITTTILSCKSSAIEPFEISISDYNYSLAYSVRYKLTDKNLKITFRGELENEKDSIIYFTNNLPKKELKKISRIDIDDLKERYKTDCIADGDIKIFHFKKQGKNKRIQVNNYYQKDLSRALELINKIVPEKFEIYHNKAELLAGQKWCEDDRKEFLRNNKAQ